MKTVSMFLALALAAFAADTPPVMSRLTIVDIPPDTSAEFYAVQRDTAEIYKANKAPMPRLAWTSLTGASRFVSVVPLEGLDKLAERTWLSQQGDEASRQARSARLRKSSGQLTYKVITTQSEVGWDPSPGAAPTAFIAVSVFVVKPGKTSDFLELLKQSVEATKKIGKAKSVYVARVSYGANWNEFHVVTGYASLADIPTTSAATRAAMGEATYNTFVEKISAAVNSIERDLYRYRPEFSYIPAK